MNHSANIGATTLPTEEVTVETALPTAGALAGQAPLPQSHTHLEEAKNAIVIPSIMMEQARANTYGFLGHRWVTSRRNRSKADIQGILITKITMPHHLVRLCL